MINRSRRAREGAGLSLGQAARRLGLTREDLAQIEADYLVYRDGRVSIGPLVLGSGELQELKKRVGTAIYSSSKRELKLRGSSFSSAEELLVAILAARRA